MRRYSKYLLFAIAFWLVLFLSWEWWYSFPKVKWTPVSFPQSQEEKIDSILVQSLSEYLIPGIAVGIIEEGKVTYLKAFGYENLETKDTLNLQSLLPVASVSKIFTALTLANYALEKGIDINEPVNSLLPKGKKLSPEFSKISLRDLLSHTSGLKVGMDINHILPSGKNRPLQQLPNSLKTPNTHKKEFHYADINFDLIGYLLENHANEPFETLSLKRILSQGGMKESSFVTQWPVENLTLIGYHKTFLWKRLESRKLNFQHLPSPSAGLFVSGYDLSNFLHQLSRGEMGIYSEELAWLKNGSDIPAGFHELRFDQFRFIGHFGGQGGFSSVLAYSPDLDIAFFVISNGRDQTDFRYQISLEVLKILNP